MQMQMVRVMLRVIERDYLMDSMTHLDSVTGLLRATDSVKETPMETVKEMGSVKCSG